VRAFASGVALFIAGNGAMAEAPRAGDGVSAAPEVAPGAQVRISSLARDAGAFDGPLPSLTWAIDGQTSVMAGAAWRADLLLPSIGLRRALLQQETSGFDLHLGVAFQSAGREDAGGELSASVLLARSFGPVSLSAAASIGKGTGIRSDIDFDAASLVTVPIGGHVRGGGEVRVHGELVDRFETAEDAGRPIGVIAGSSMSLSTREWVFDILAGWERPRGLAPSRPLAVATAAWLF
jgi:hypothetical protein